jgi:hypothetical protein
MRLLKLALIAIGLSGAAPAAVLPVAQPSVTITLVRWPFT